MEEIILENNEIKFVASKNERTKSLVNFGVLDKSSNKILFELYSENDNLTDGNISIKVKYCQNDNIQNENLNKTLRDSIEMFVNFCFANWPLKNIYYQTYQNDTSTINILMKIGFVVEANLKDDYYYEGKYISRIILTLKRK